MSSTGYFRRGLSRSSLRAMAVVARGPRCLTAAAPSCTSFSPTEFPEKISAPSIVARASVSAKETSGVVGLAVNRSFHGSSRPLSGTNACVNPLSFAGRSVSYLNGGMTGSSTGDGKRHNKTSIRCDATVAEKEAAPVEKFEYQAEVTRLLDLIIHSLYSNKEIFLRELVSNASDALDKLRFLSVTEPELLAANPNLEIRIQADPEKGIITITDSGLGMTREELVRSLGTIAESGTAKFMKALKESKDKTSSDSNLIGQFGVGFYSAFLVADKVSVSSKSVKSDRQFVWEGEADTGVFTISEETNPEKFIPRGTSVTLYLKTDAKDEYGDPARIQSLVKNYSQFIAFPIYTFQENTRSKEVDEEGAIPENRDAEAEKQTKKTVTEKYWDWELTNETKPIWLRSIKDVSKEDYHGFFKSTFNEFMDPMAFSHFSTEGEIEFKSLLFVPGMVPFNADEINIQKSRNIKLYVKRVFISDQFDGELLPSYLSFIKGVVDSNDLPLNVSREILQESRIVRIMKKRLVSKIFDMIKDIANREDKNKYKLFWMIFGKHLKQGCIEDSANHKKLGPLLRFYSSKGGKAKTGEDEYITLDEYLERMKESQSAIYYLPAETVQSAKSAPFLEELYKRDLEVIFLVDPIDELAITSLASYKEKKFVDVSKEDLDLDSEDKEKDKEAEKEYQPLCDWMKASLGEKVAKVKISKRISSSPCVLVSGKLGWSANMERIIKAQSFGDNTQVGYMRGRRVLEINPDHPIIQDLNVVCKETPRSPRGKQMLQLLFETAELSSGFTPENAAEFGGRVYEMMTLALPGAQEIVTSQNDSKIADAEYFEEMEVQNEPDSEDSDAEFSEANFIHDGSESETVEPSEGEGRRSL